MFSLVAKTIKNLPASCGAWHRHLSIPISYKTISFIPVLKASAQALFRRRKRAITIQIRIGAAVATKKQSQFRARQRMRHHGRQALRRMVETGRRRGQRQQILGLRWTSRSHKCVNVIAPHMTELPGTGETAPRRRRGRGGRGRREGNVLPPRHCWGKKTWYESENEGKKMLREDGGGGERRSWWWVNGGHERRKL